MWIPARVTKYGKAVQAFQIDSFYADAVKRHQWRQKPGGYLDTKIAGKRITLHRFIWKISGRTPTKFIDHINGDRADNRIDNLRAASSLLNNKNNNRRTATKNGLPVGVLRQKNGRFTARARHRKQDISLGTYDTAEEASAVYQNAKEILIEFANLPGYENVITGGVS